MKQIAPIWKREFFEGGDVWIEGATADPDDAARAGRGGAGGMRVTVRLFARLRDIAGAAELRARRRAGRDDRIASGASWRGEFPELGALRAIDFDAPSTPTTRGWTSASRDGDEVAFLPPVSGG